MPERPVVAFTGDAGLLACLGELATAARLGLPLTTVVFVDGSLSLTRALQEQHRYAPIGVSLEASDLPRLAESLGILGTAVDEEGALAAALREALDGARPTLIAARVRGRNYRRLLDILRGREDPTPDR